jgi:hypothetical protein
MAKILDHPARGALPAGLPARFLAQDQLAEPQSEALLADAARAVKKKRLGQSTRMNRLRQPFSNCVMTVQRAKTHGRQCT